MRIYESPDGKQLLADLRSEGGSRDIALGTLDRFKAGILVAGKLAELRDRSPQLALEVRPAAQLDLATAGTYRLSHALAYFVDFGDHHKEATREAHRANQKYLLKAIGNPPLDAVDWYHLAVAARDAWKKAGLSNDTCNKRIGTLSRALDLAFRPLGGGHRYLVTPAVMPRQLPSQTIARTRWMPPEELSALAALTLVYAGKDRRSFHHYPERRRVGRAFRIFIRAWTGVRNADTRRLIVGDFSIVRGTWKRISSKRSAPVVELKMPEPMMAIVDQWLRYATWLRQKDQLLYHWPDEHRGLEILTEHLRIEHITPHDYRRTAAHLIRLCGLDKDFCRLWLGLTAKSQLLEQVYLTDDPLAQPDPQRVRELAGRFGGADAPHLPTTLRDAPVTRYAPAAQPSQLPPTNLQLIASSKGDHVMSRTHHHLRGNKDILRQFGPLRGHGRGETEGKGVPRDRVELSTHGFSGLADQAENTAKSLKNQAPTSNEPPTGIVCGNCQHVIGEQDSLLVKGGLIVGCSHCAPVDDLNVPPCHRCTTCGAVTDRRPNFCAACGARQEVLS